MNQAIAFKLADMKMQIDAARTARVARVLDGVDRQGVRQPAKARCRSSTPARSR